MKIVEMKIADLKVAKYNPRTISDAAMAGLEQSLSRFGYVEPVVFNARTGNIVGGHQRVRALSKAGLKTIPVVQVDVELSEEKALNVALNNPHIAGEFTDDLQALLVELESGDKALFKDLRLDKLMARTAADEHFEEEWSGRHEVTVECKDEAEQKSLYERLTADGYSCRVLTL